jgi:hypothetical protein
MVDFVCSLVHPWEHNAEAIEAITGVKIKERVCRSNTDPQLSGSR